MITKSFSHFCSIPHVFLTETSRSLEDQGPASSRVCKYIVYVVVQIFPWFKIFQTSLFFIFLCFKHDNYHRTKKNKNQTGLKKY